MSPPVDRRETDRLVVEHLPAALRFATKLTGDTLVAEEVVQEALVRVLRHWRSYRGESSFRTWLLGIVLNVDRDRRRKRFPERLPAVEPAAQTASPGEDFAATELAERVRRAIAALPDRQREVAIACLAERLPAREAAEVLGTTEANIHATLHLVRKRLAQALGMSEVNRHEG